MNIPQEALEIVKFYEGFRANAYKCQAGIWTIGYGTTRYSNGNFVKEGDKINKYDAELELYKYIERECMPQIYDIENKINKKLSTNQICSLVLLIYNVGAFSFKNSKCKKYIINNDCNNACKQWDWGVKQGLKGLITRRNKEIELFYGIKDFWKC